MLAQEPPAKKQKSSKGTAVPQTFGDIANFFFDDLVRPVQSKLHLSPKSAPRLFERLHRTESSNHYQESTEFADADILADWEVPDINKPQRRARA